MAHQPVQSSKNDTTYYSQLETGSPEKPGLRRHHLWGGWRTTVSSGAIITFIALVVNIAILIWASKEKPPDNNAGTGIVTLYNGSCPEMNKIFTWSHLGVNVVSTLLLCAGTACMQCLSAPTRQEIDTAHSKRTWLDIGVPNLRNFKWMSRERQVLWVLLGLSSLPLHLFYNSVIFSTTSANDYSAFMVADNFLHTGASYGNITQDAWNGQNLDAMNISQIQHLQNNLPSLVKLDVDDCFKAYQTSLVSDYKDVLLVTSIFNTTNAVLGVIPQLVGQYSVEGSACSGSITCWDGSQKNGTSWTFTLYPGTGFQPVDSTIGQTDPATLYQHVQVPVDYCLAEPSTLSCTISLSRVYLGVVIICNAIKFVCILSTLTLRGYRPLITIGDAIESFMLHPDSMTKATTLSASEVRKQEAASLWSIISTRPWFPFPHVWAEAASPRRWAATTVCLILVWAAALALLIKGAMASSDHPDIWRDGLGVLNLGSVLNFSESMGVTVDVLIVNLPQVVLSFVYLMYNGLFTCMTLTEEYLQFANHRKPLRVTDPRGAQRSTYWLQLPYRYAIPFLIAMGVLHWLVSQSIFLVRIAVIDQNGMQDYSREVGGCGWSPDALIATVILGAFIILTLFGFGFRKLPSGMPIVSSCSAAISAACHRADSDGKDVVIYPLQYGVVKGGNERIQQVGFSAQEVQPLEEEVIYGCRDEGKCRSIGVGDFDTIMPL